MNSTKRTIIIAVAVVICAVAVIFGGIFGASRIIHKDEVEAIKAEKESEKISSSAQQENTSQYAVIPNAPDGAVQYGGEELFNDNAKNNVLEPGSANKNASSGSNQGSASDGSGANNGGSSEGSAAQQPGGRSSSGAPYALSSNDKAAVLDYYKKVSNINANLLFHKSLKLVSMNGGETVKESWVNAFRGMAEKGLAKNNIDDEPYPGKPNQIMVSDWQSASAVSDGRYTTLTVHVVPQVDDANGSQFAGPCGRSMGVLDGMQRALQDLPLVTIESMDMTISYVNPVIKLKVDNQTGKLVKGGCSWSYRTNIHINSLQGKAVVNINLKNASGTIDYKVSY